MKQHPAGGRQSPKSEIRRSKEIRSPKAEIPLGETKSELGRKEWNSSDFDLRNSFGLRVSDFGRRRHVTSDAAARRAGYWLTPPW